MESQLKRLLILLLILILPGCESRVRYMDRTPTGIEIGGYPVVIKEIPSLKYVHQQARFKKTEMKQHTQTIATALFAHIGAMEAVNIIGPLTYVIDDLAENRLDIVHLKIGFPVDRKPPIPATVVEQSYMELAPFKCLTVRLPLDDRFTQTTWLRLYQAAYGEGYVPTGQGRTVITFNDTGSNYVMELQLGIKG